MPRGATPATEVEAEGAGGQRGEQEASRRGRRGFSDPDKALGQSAAPRWFLSVSVLSNSLLLHSGGPRALASALYWARFSSLVVVRAPVATATLPSVTSHRFSPLQTAELPWNHYNSPSGFDPVLRCYTSQGRTTCDGRSRAADIRVFTSSCISLFFSVRYLFQSTRSACRGITHHRTISISLCAPLR